jgi:hypothetical protein
MTTAVLNNTQIIKASDLAYMSDPELMASKVRLEKAVREHGSARSHIRELLENQLQMVRRALSMAN